MQLHFSNNIAQFVVQLSKNFLLQLLSNIINCKKKQSLQHQEEDVVLDKPKSSEHNHSSNLGRKLGLAFFDQFSNFRAFMVYCYITERTQVTLRIWWPNKNSTQIVIIFTTVSQLFQYWKKLIMGRVDFVVVFTHKQVAETSHRYLSKFQCINTSKNNGQAKTIGQLIGLFNKNHSPPKL